VGRGALVVAGIYGIITADILTLDLIETPLTVCLAKYAYLEGPDAKLPQIVIEYAALALIARIADMLMPSFAENASGFSHVTLTA